MYSSVLRVGSLCSGYAGLDMAVMSVFPGSEVIFFAENDLDASKILAKNFPGIPNLGDISVVQWKSLQIAPIDLLAAGFPCTDVSLAGGREGLIKGNRSGLWYEVGRAIDELRPSLVFLENVDGLRSARADDSHLERCPGCMGDGAGEPLVRALGTVLGDLASLGYDAQWTSIRAADAGAPHRRLRIFVLAHADGDTERAGSLERRGGLVAPVEGDEES